ncbi:PREDICTED: coiled-coil domain-containing protein 37-like [Mesitornis unicolor]|uniref:coiled-coil domain-containing protein 37-like n=1 Tax=Mesitornis unicolor TaxID=54374 RepID=UPI0005280A59|nr:PREDICTED: coiled-coil domain-containing protein 37-like [Mesitornis unicolor]
MSVCSSSSRHSALSQETQSAEETSGPKMPSPHSESTCKSLSSGLGLETQLVLPESPEGGEKSPMKNPFTIPPNVGIFTIRDKERKKAKEERERMKTMKIHEKMTYSTKIKAKPKPLREALQKEEEEDRKQTINEESLKILQDSLAWKKAIGKDYPLEKQTFHDDINDRKETFLLKYAIAVKRDEMQRMEKVAKNKERKVKMAEDHLEKDIATFHEFLKQNQTNFIQALKTARRETAAKKTKTMEVRAISSQIENIQSDIARFKNTLQEYKMYRDFLYHLSPKEWQEEYEKKHRKKKDLQTASEANEQDAASPYGTGCTDVPSSLLSSKSLGFRLLQEFKPQLKHFLKLLSARKIISLEDVESENCSDEDEEPELYFTDPQQLLSVFTEMEEENLSFIHNSQEIKESLNEVQHTFIKTHESMKKQLAELKQQAGSLKSSVAKAEEKVADLKLKVHFSSSAEDNAVDQDKVLTSLNKKVLEVYCHCTGEKETNLEAVQMLTVIEKQLNDLLDTMERIPPAMMQKAEKAHKKEQRMRLREEKLRLEKQQQEERMHQALERSQALVIKKKKKRLSQEQVDKEKEEQLYYFT